jgi:hypothetical protein
MVGKIFITREGYDPQLGKHIKDPYLDGTPTLGGCRPDVRKQFSIGDYLFVISGKVKGANQFVMGGFQIERKISANDAYLEFPDQRLRLRDDGQLTGNVIVAANGQQHELDNHDPETFADRVDNYIVGCDPIVLSTDAEIERARKETLAVLQEILKKKGASPRDIVTRFGKKITDEQVSQLRAWLLSLKTG